ncbi:MAG: nicotinamide mononucleotide transporter [Muribaculaceae bacterium]|nr:nicotinamide mononucleotide transporter [Muribaculaceae bacterium]
MDAVVQYFSDFTWVKAIDMVGLVLGLIYLWLEFKASIWLWLVSIVMPIVHGYLYWARGLYADFGMEVYYVLAAVYGYAMWRWARGRTDDTGGAGEKAAERPITHFPLRRVLPVTLIGLALWGGIYWILVTFTNSNVPLCDSFTTALSIVALWALAQKYAEQWLLWLVVDLVCTVLYIYKQIPFTACLYGFYTVMAVLGYFYWLKKMRQQPA